MKLLLVCAGVSAIGVLLASAASGFLGRYVLSGRTSSRLSSHATEGPVVSLDKPATGVSNEIVNRDKVTSEPRPLEVVVFISSDCSECQIIRTQVIPEIEQTFGSLIVIREYDLVQESAHEKFLEYEGLFGSHEDTMTKMFVGNHYLAGADNIRARAVSMIEKILRGSNTGV